MPKYFFSLHNHVVETDDVGLDLPDIAVARLEAIRFGGEILRDQPELLDHSKTLSIEVTTEDGAVAFRLDIMALPAVD